MGFSTKRTKTKSVFCWFYFVVTLKCKPFPNRVHFFCHTIIDVSKINSLSSAANNMAHLYFGQVLFKSCTVVLVFTKCLYCKIYYIVFMVCLFNCCFTCRWHWRCIHSSIYIWYSYQWAGNTPLSMFQVTSTDALFDSYLETSRPKVTKFSTYYLYSRCQHISKFEKHPTSISIIVLIPI